MKLIIFDLDQTIIELHKFHNKATMLIFKKVFGIVAWLTEIDFAGKTIEKDLEDLAILKKIPQKTIKKRLPEAIRLYGKIFISIMPKSMRAHVLPGAENLIQTLKKDKKNILVLVTGDERVIAEKVLSKAHLLKYFRFIITGEKTRSRTKLTRQAIKKAKAHAKIEKVFIIGDSIHEIESAKATNSQVISVLTGFHSKAQLKKAGARNIFRNLKDKRILKLLGN
jgi:phosphoglycolate phosphatase-like HAD superfamily hydrolase